MPNRTNMNLNVDLRNGVVPISKAASSLAALIKRANTSGQPVIVTQKGYPTGVLLPIELFAALKGLFDGRGENASGVGGENADSPGDKAVAPVAQEEAPPASAAPVTRRRKPKVAVPDETIV